MIQDGIALSQDLMNAIAPNAGQNAQLKFDDYGTLHILDRDDDGTLIKDYACFRYTEEEKKLKPTDYNKQIKQVKKKKKRYNRLFKLVVFNLFLLLVVSGILVWASFNWYTLWDQIIQRF